MPLDERVDKLQQMYKKSEIERKRLEKETAASSNLIEFQKQLIEKLENESARMSHVYSKLAASQKRLITLLETKYNEILHSLIDSFDDIDSAGSSYETKVEEIQTDLNNLIQILGTGGSDTRESSSSSLSSSSSSGSSESMMMMMTSGQDLSPSSLSSLERPLNEQSPSSSSFSIRSMRRMLSDQLLAIESSESSFSDVSWTPNYDDSFYMDLNLNHSMRSHDSKVR